ncbi:MAG: ShlB/FhaC/HecB family hemolysin secretion/activation protein [Polaromonas sp.]|uniref:ShlB/FhaC/HecB family hemolysin secretion/activation protein n=1 Tax=Polaromonas sp. TaxID=1869339 RepID=UPI0025F98C24|nr:ShlB/FhaC/HecB family hemolysin secretion/activation protein [Polaromonas sp.]MBI2727611.1 ShlB/FhaC/HecB family hemolysin secretion/activation protein [Polaromonas sp.]
MIFSRPATLGQLFALGLMAFGADTASSQTRPNAGTLLESQPPAPVLPRQGEPRISLPDAKPAPAATANVRITPKAFRLTGNTIFSFDELNALLARFVDQPVDIAGLTAAATTISNYYRSKGYLLTEAYLPEQTLAATGGTVTIRVIEAKIGKTTVEVQGDGSGISRSFAEEVMARHMTRGDAVTEYGLDKPILLLRDLAGYDASAVVEPGENPGEANVRVAITSRGPGTEGSVSADNYGASAAGAVHASANLNINNLTGRGDVLSLGGQIGDQAGSNLYRAAWSLPVGGWGTRVGLNAARLNYALGKQFAALGASGKADLFGLSMSHPLVRGRENNAYLQVSADHKRLLDRTTTPLLKSEREMISLRAGLSGNFVDRLADLTASNSYSLSSTLGRLTLDPADMALDQGFGGLHTAGAFRKLNAEYQRVQFFGGASSLYFTAQTQIASKNLSSAEKMALGGPNGVRSYPVGEGIGDSGTMFNLEYRYQLPSAVSLLSEPVSLLAFYDYGQVRLNQEGPPIPGSANGITLSSVGLGFMLGRIGNFLIKTHLAWRTTPALPTTGDADRSPRAWLSAQKWF